MIQDLIRKFSKSSTAEILAEQAFSEGDYSKSFRLAESNELRASSAVMLGMFEDHLPGILESRKGRDVFCSSIALWALGDKAAALDRLRRILRDPIFGLAARRLLSYLEAPSVRFLVQTRDDPQNSSFDVASAFRTVPGMDVKTVGYSSRSDVVISHDTDLPEMLRRLPMGWTPDIFFSHLTEDHPPPVGIEKAAFPTFCDFEDYDRHFHHVFHLFPLFDAAICLGSVDHGDMKRFTGRAFVFPFVMGVEIGETPSMAAEKDIDIFVSGTLFNNNEDKTKALYAISQLSERYRIVLKEGYLTREEYFRYFERSKFTFSYVNRWGLMNGRAIEALSKGCGVFYQEGGELGLLASREDGAVPWGRHNGEAVITRALEEWETVYRHGVLVGAAKVSKYYDLKSTAKRFFHLLVAYGALCPKKTKNKAPGPFSKFRYPNRSVWRIPYVYDFSESHWYKKIEDFSETSALSGDHISLDAAAEARLYGYLLEKKAKDRVITLQEYNKFNLLRYRNLFIGAHQSIGPVDVTSPEVFKDSRLLFADSPKALADQIKQFLNPADFASEISRMEPGGARYSEEEKARFRALQAETKITSKMFHASFLDRAISLYQRLRKLVPDHLAASFNLGRLYYEKGDKPNALNLFLSILKNPALVYKPDNLLFWREFHDDFFDYDLMMREIVNYRRTQGVQHLRAIEGAIRESSIFYIAKIYESNGELDRAREFLQGHTSNETKLFALWFLKTDLEARCGQHSKAIGTLRFIFKMKPHFLAHFGKSLSPFIELHQEEIQEVFEAWKKLASRVQFLK